MRSPLQPCASAVSSAAAEEEAGKRPSSAAAAAPSPRRNGEKGQACVLSDVQLAILRQRQPSFAPRSGEKVVRQHRMRGRGRWGAIDVAAVRESHFIGGCRRRSWKAPLIRGCRRTFSPSQRGEGTGMRFHQNAALHACDDASRPFAPRSGEKGPACAFISVLPCILATAPAVPSPRAAGRRWCGSTG